PQRKASMDAYPIHYKRLINRFKDVELSLGKTVCTRLVSWAPGQFTEIKRTGHGILEYGIPYPVQTITIFHQDLLQKCQLGFSKYLVFQSAVGKQLLGDLDKLGGKTGPVKSRRPRNNAVKVIRIALGFHHCLTASTGRSYKITVLRRFTVILFYKVFAYHSGTMDRQMAEVQLTLHIILSPGRWIHFRMTRIGTGRGISLLRQRPQCIRYAADKSATAAHGKTTVECVR